MNLTADALRKLLDYNPETGKFARKTKWGSQNIGDEPGSLSKQGYWQIGVFGRTHPAHRLAWLHHYGEWPPHDVDHINRNRLDNRIENLRLTTRSENLHNSGARASSSSGVKGVALRSLRRGKRPNKQWVAHIMVNNKRFHLGNYYTLEEATAARQQAEKTFTNAPC
jgi:hypothetical protein